MKQEVILSALLAFNCPQESLEKKICFYQKKSSQVLVNESLIAIQENKEKQKPQIEYSAGPATHQKWKEVKVYNSGSVWVISKIFQETQTNADGYINWRIELYVLKNNKISLVTSQVLKTFKVEKDEKLSLVSENMFNIEARHGNIFWKLNGVEHKL